MPAGLTDDIAACGSIAVVGLAKNVGKTMTLNHIIRETHRNGLKTGVTSIGVDGETTDRVTSTRKPEIKIYGGMLFATSEKHYRERRLESEVLGLGSRRSALGRIVTARALTEGKTLLSGPSETAGVSDLIRKMRGLGADTVLVDGALSRLSPASPTVTDAMILATGAALSPDIAKIVSRTAFVCSLIDLPMAERKNREKLEGIIRGVWSIDAEGALHDLKVNSALELEALKNGIFQFGKTIFIAGMVGDKLMKFLAVQKDTKDITLIVKDFTRLFIEPDTLKTFRRAGGRIEVLGKSKLIGVTINPWSPTGYVVDKDKLLREMSDRLSVPVYNIV